MSKREDFRTVAMGFVMGIAEAIPGVSGSTLALVMGIYERFINLLHAVSDVAKVSVRAIFRKGTTQDVLSALKTIEFRFAISLGVGMIIAILGVSNLITFLFDNYPQYVHSFFFGLVLMSVLIPFRLIRNKSFTMFGLIVLSAVITFVLLGVRPTLIENPSPLYLYFAGILGVSGLILPGVSGSFILLLLGVYEHVIGLVKDVANLNLSMSLFISLSIFILGLITGFVSFVRVVKYALLNHADRMLSIIVGLMLGSLRVLYPFYEITVNGDKQLFYPFGNGLAINSLVVLLLLLSGCFVVAFLGKISNGRTDSI